MHKIAVALKRKENFTFVTAHDQAGTKITSDHEKAKYPSSEGRRERIGSREVLHKSEEK
jgi:hypothetical protein